MPRQTLTGAEVARLGLAAPGTIVQRGASVRKYMADHGRWLGVANAYRDQPVDQLKVDISAGRVNNKHLAEYVAASAPLHAIEGWTYLGRALQAHVAGDSDVCRHLAYYAELRGAMALLATQAIGVFSSQHLVIDAHGGTHAITHLGTHQAAWLFLEDWATRGHASVLLGSVIRPEGQTLLDWIDALALPAAWAPVAADMLLQFGLDLRRLADDREARNEASYRPAIGPVVGVQAGDAVDFVLDFVSFLEPQAPASFRRLDLHLLRVSIERAFRSATNSTARQAPVQFRNAVTTAVQAMIHDPARWDTLIQFLTRQTVPDDPLLLAEAARTVQTRGARHHLQVACRAALLLRVATGLVAKLLGDVGLSLQECASWWHPLGELRGMWLESPPDAGEIDDLWLDIGDALSDISDWRIATSEPSYRGLRDDCAQSLDRVAALDTVGLVGIAS